MFLDLLQRITLQLSGELPFVVYRKPNEDQVTAILQKDITLHKAGDYTESGFVFAPFDSDHPAILIKANELLQTTYIPNEDIDVTTKLLLGTNLSQKEFHVDLVTKGIKEIQSGNLEKVVLSRKFEVDYDKTPLELFKDLLATYTTALCYLWYHPKVGLWLGATPEILLRHENKRLITMSLAGTQANTGDNNPVWGHKEKEEQALVTNYISKVLGDKISYLKVSETESVRAGNIWHLRTSVSGVLDKDRLQEIVEVLHPTPAVCGIPKEAAKAFILENEGYNREFYTGFLGELNVVEQKDRTTTRRNQENKAYGFVKRKTALYVNLRCMQLLDNKAIIYVGGGVTRGSDAKKEWQETVAKSTTMLHVILNKT